MEDKTNSTPDPIKEYEPTWESVHSHQVPEWALDAKFGVYAHWGPYCIAGEWPENTEISWGNHYVSYQEGVYDPDTNSERRKCFEKHYGPITEGFGYKELCADFTAEKFDPEFWADVMAKSGAKYAGICAMHHEGFAMWDTALTEFKAPNIGAKRDLFGEIITAIEKRGLKTIATVHHERTHKNYNKLIDNLTEQNVTGVDILPENQHELYWFLGDEENFKEKRTALTNELVDKYKPDVLWFDGGASGGNPEEILAHYLNMGLREGKEVCVHNKRNFGENFGIYSYENGARRTEFVEWPWEDDTPSAVGWCDWSSWFGQTYKKADDLIKRLIDLVARNGGLLLSLNPRADGSLDQEQVDLLLGMGAWLEQNGEAIYSTRPWVYYAEGHKERQTFLEHHPVSGKPAVRWIQPDVDKFDESDIRFTVNGNTLFAIQVVPSKDGKTVIKTLANTTNISSENTITSVELLGHGAVAFERTDDALVITLPEALPNECSLAFKITVGGELIQRKPLPEGTVVPYMTEEDRLFPRGRE